MPTFLYDKHAVHSVLGSVSSNSNISTLPTSWIIFFDSGLNGLFAWFCRRSCWRACRSGWFSIFWINSRTLVLCACFTTECGNPGIRKSMFTAFSIVCSWLKLSWLTTGLSVLSRSVLSPTLTVSLSRQERVWELSGTFSVFVPTNESPRSFMCLFNVGILTVFRWTCLDHTRFNNGSHRSLWRNSFFVKRIKIDLLRTERFSSFLESSRVIHDNGSPRSFTTWT